MREEYKKITELGETLNGRSDEWRIKQFNRNRDSSEWVHTIKELEDRIDKIFKD